MEIHQLILKLQTPSKEEIRYKVGEVLGKSATSEVEQALRLIYGDEIRKRGRQFVENETEGHYRDAVKSEILMIDDLGCEPEVCMIYGVRHTPIQNLLYDRYRFQRPTVITSNLTDKELLERYGIRMKDRMDETFDFITFSNQSYRKQE